MLIGNAYGERNTVEYAVPDGVQGEVVIDAPVTDVCNAADLGSFPLHLVYYYITYASPTVGEQYSLQIPGMELVYAAMPPDEPQPVLGDVNGDGEVNISDVSCIIDLILSGTVSPAGDVNGDGEVNITDINMVIDIILS